MRLVRTALYLSFCLASSMAHANTCSALQQQMRSAEQGHSPHAASLSRQLAAIQRHQKQRRCSARSQGGFFNPCQGLANREANVRAQLGKLGGVSAGTPKKLRARFVALGCGAPQERPAQAAQKKPVGNEGGQQRHAKGAQLFCVRLKDGYYFPAPTSQIAGNDKVENQLARCRSVCETENMQLYVLDSLGKESEEMVSVKDGKAYTHLPTAFRYRDEGEFSRCNFRGYHLQAAEERSNKGTLSAYADVVMPVPRGRPAPLTTTDKLQGTRLAENSSDQRKKPVRVILPAPGGDASAGGVVRVEDQSREPAPVFVQVDPLFRPQQPRMLISAEN
jgi:hypothetical protein